MTHHLDRKHPDMHAPWQEWSNEQTLHVASCYVNPCRWRTRRENANRFRQHMQQSHNVALHMGEIAYGDRPHEITRSNCDDVQLRTDHELWHKENSLNVVIQRFPENWKYGAIIDADFHMTRPDWAFEAIQLLQHYDWIQLYDSVSYLSGDHRPFKITPTSAWSYMNHGRDGIKANFNDQFIKQSKKGEYDPYGAGKFAGAPGGAWAFRRSAFDTVGGLLDVCILGSGDWYMAVGLMGEISNHREQIASVNFSNAIIKWQERAHKIKKNVGCMQNHAIHYFHGAQAKRNYNNRWQILARNQFDPLTDIAKDWQGLWQLTGNKPDFRDDIRDYFRDRDEDDPTVGVPHLV